MTEEQRPLRAYQPWTDREYGVLGGCHAGGVSVDSLAKGLSRYPSEVEDALIKLKGLNEAMTNKQDQLANGRCNVYKPKTSTHTEAELAEVSVYREKRVNSYLPRKLRRLIINGKNYDLLLEKAKKRVHLRIEISATLAGGK